MTQRSMRIEKNQTIIIKAGASVSVRGHDSDWVNAETQGRWGLTIERRSEAQIARARAVIGEHVLFDLRLKKPTFSKGEENQGVVEVIEIQMGGSGEILVPYASNLKIYAGANIDVQGIKGQVSAYAGKSLVMLDVYSLANVSAGQTMAVDCQTMAGTDLEINAGSDLRFHIADLTSARLRVRDLGGYWEARVGSAEKSVYLKSGGDVTFVTDQKVEPLPPDFILGMIEKPAAS